MKRSSLFRPQLADPSYRPSLAESLWIVALGISAILFAFTLPWGFGRGAELSLGESSLLGVTALVMALDLPRSLIRAKREGLWPRYRGKWLLLDILAALPLLVIVLSEAGFLVGNTARIVAVLGLSKCWKLHHILAAIRLRALQYANAVTMGSILLWAALTVHWIATGWLSLRGYDSSLSQLSNYLDALYWTGTTLSAVGYGDITPRTDLEKVYALVTMVAGLAFFGYLVGLLASFWSRRDPGRAEFNRNVEQLSQAVRATSLPPELQHRVFNYYSYMWRERGWYDESEFLRELPPTLRGEVAVHMKKDVLERVDLFRGAGERFCREVANHLHWEVMTPGGYLIHEGDPGERMYFIVRGEVEVLKGPDETVTDSMGPGDFFGEIALFTEGPRTASVRAMGFSEVYWLAKSDFDRVAARYPAEVAPIREKARARSSRGGWGKAD